METRAAVVYAFAGKGAVKKLLLSQREKKTETIALMRTSLTNPGGDEESPKRWANSFPPSAPGRDHWQPQTTVTTNRLFACPKKSLAFCTG